MVGCIKQLWDRWAIDGDGVNGDGKALKGDGDAENGYGKALNGDMGCSIW